MISRGILSAGGSASTTIWSTTNKSSNITLSGGNLKFTGSGTAGGTCIANIGKSTGKWYMCEITINALPSLVAASEMIGIATLFSNTAVLGNYTNSVGYRRNAGTLTTTFLRNFGAGSAFVGTTCPDLAVGNVVSLVVDMTGLSLTVYIDSIQAGSVLTIPAGTWYPACASDGSSGAATANFGATSFASVTSSLRTTLTGAGYNIGLY